MSINDGKSYDEYDRNRIYQRGDTFIKNGDMYRCVGYKMYIPFYMWTKEEELAFNEICNNKIFFRTKETKEDEIQSFLNAARSMRQYESDNPFNGN